MDALYAIILVYRASCCFIIMLNLNSGPQNDLIADKMNVSDACMHAFKYYNNTFRESVQIISLVQ